MHLSDAVSSSLLPSSHHISQICPLLSIHASITQIQVTITWISLLSGLPPSSPETRRLLRKYYLLSTHCNEETNNTLTSHTVGLHHSLLKTVCGFLLPLK